MTAENMCGAGIGWYVRAWAQLHYTTKSKTKSLFFQILVMLVPREKADHNDIILEVSSGIGGQEAMLFTQEIFDMYTNFAVYKGWDCVVITYDSAETGNWWNQGTWCLWLLGVTVFKLFVFSQPSVVCEQRLDKRLNSTVTPSGQEVNHSSVGAFCW